MSIPLIDTFLAFFGLIVAVTPLTTLIAKKGRFRIIMVIAGISILALTFAKDYYTDQDQNNKDRETQSGEKKRDSIADSRHQQDAKKIDSMETQLGRIGYRFDTLNLQIVRFSPSDLQLPLLVMNDSGYMAISRYNQPKDSLYWTLGVRNRGKGAAYNLVLDVYQCVKNGEGYNVRYTQEETRATESYELAAGQVLSVNGHIQRMQIDTIFFYIRANYSDIIHRFPQTLDRVIYNIPGTTITFECITSQKALIKSILKAKGYI